jgi:hypothetical protein
MKKLVGLAILFSSIGFEVFSQVDTTYIYNTAMPYGTLDLRIAKSATRYYYLQEDVTFSYRESSPGVRSTQYRDMTSWESNAYRQGNLREKNGTSDLFVMNYRLLFPLSYQAEYSPGYPIVLILHGAGEAGNCWGNTCYWSTTAWDPNVNDPAAPSTNLALLNNDRNLFHGGKFHLDAVKAAGTRLPNDPSMPSNAFPGFVLFPQSLNGWSQPQKVEEAIKLLRLIMKKYKIDKNRIYIHGLSNGGGGVNQALKRAPWLFASAATMSAVSDGQIVLHNQVNEVKKIPLWVFQGGQDTNPTPSKTFNFVKKMRDAGADIRYSLYPALGHGTWNTAFKEPDFLTWILGKKKYNPHVSYGNPVICQTTGTGVTLSFSKGFFAYQWQKDGVIITDQTAAEFIASTPGSYRGRFSRKPNPTEADFEPWSDPVTVSIVNPAKPSFSVIGSTHLRGPGLVSNNTNNTVVLSSNVNAGLYEWYKDNQLVNFPTTDIDDTLKTAPVLFAGSEGNGWYQLKIKNSYCPSPASDSVYLYFGNSAPQNIILNKDSTNFRGIAYPSSIYFTWNDIVENETGFEIWRRKKGTSDFKFAGKASANSISFLDKQLEPATVYEYKFRAINNGGRSNYIPADDLTVNYSITTTADRNKPAPPQNLKIVSNDINSISISWEPASDDHGLKDYVVIYGPTQISVPSTTLKYTITNLAVNQVYPIVIRARDFTGQFSEPSNQVIGVTYVTSLFYKHSTGAWVDLDDSTLVATWSAPEFTGTVSNFSLAMRTQEDFYNFLFTGYLNIATSADYTFRVTSDDGSRLKISGAVVVDNDGKHGVKAVTSTPVTLAAGLYPIELQYFDNTGFQSLTVEYSTDGVNFIPIPDAALRSGEYTPPAAPLPPDGITASGTGMKQIDLSWSFADDTTTDFEIYRSTSSDGIYKIVARSSTLGGIDTLNLTPGSTYYYKLKTVTPTATSALSAAVTATTLIDNIAPSVPSNLTLMSKNTSMVAFSWTSSTDNVGVKNYEISANQTVAGTSSTPSFTASNLTSNTTYVFSVVAIDANGNRSEASSGLTVQTDAPPSTAPPGGEDPGDGGEDPGEGGEDPGDGGEDPGNGDPGNGSGDPGTDPGDPGVPSDTTGVPSDTTIVAVNPDVMAGFSADVFPIPGNANDLKIVIYSSNAEPVKVTGITLAGQQWYQRAFSPEEFGQEHPLVPTRTLGRGIYVLFIRQGDRKITKKISIEN